MALWQDIEKNTRGFVAAGIFDRDGMIIDGYTTDPNFHMEHAAATFISLIEESDLAGETTGLGATDEVQLTYHDVFILLRRVPLSERGLLVGLASRKQGATLGKIRMTMDILMKRLTSGSPSQPPAADPQVAPARIFQAEQHKSEAKN